MDESTKATIEKYKSKLDTLDAQARKIKVAINGLCELEGEELMYPDVDEGSQDQPWPPLVIRPDQFYGRKLATVVREILTWRQQRNQGAISLDELYDQMTQGGFDLEGKDEALKKRTLAITIGKNTAFARVPNTGYIGLAEWYPNAKKKPAVIPMASDADDDDDGELKGMVVQVLEKRGDIQNLAGEQPAEQGK